MKKIILFSLFTFSQIVALSAQQLQDSLRAELTHFIEKSRIPGLGVSIVSDEGILYTAGFGFKDKAQKIPYDSLTIQPIASISKTLVGIALMKLVEAGKADLQADINTILPFKVINPYFPNHKITLFQLATHTSSINDTYKAENAAYLILDKSASTDHFPKEFSKDYKHYLKTKQLGYANLLKLYLSADGEKFKKYIFGKYKPGTQYTYTNFGAALAAYIVEILAGQPFKTFTEEQIFKPLEMTNTAWSKSEIDTTLLAQLYFQNGSKVPDYTFQLFPAGMLHTNSQDMSKYLLEIVKGYLGKGQLLKKMTYQKMMSNQLKSNKLEKSSGIFWDVNKEESNIGHTGSNYGVTSRLIFNPNLKKAFFLTMNIFSHQDEELIKDNIGLLMIISKYAKKMN